MKKSIMLIGLLLLATGCSTVEATGDAVSAVGKGAGEAIVGTDEAVGEGVETVVSGTGEAIDDAAKKTRVRGY